jgi:putative CocE/NonD family hydrolase
MTSLRILAILALTAGPLASQQYDGWTRTSQYLTMRDGVRLATDIFRPTRGGVLHTEKLPVVWTHHRYHRAFFRNDSLIAYPGGFGRGMDLLLKNGYIIVAVDTRGGGASFGTQPGFFSPAESQDAYEVTEWLARQPWSTGNVGMTGRSYLGITQLFAASRKPPHLKAIFPEMAVFEWYPTIYPGGIYRDDFFEHWQLLTHQLDNSVKFKWGGLLFQGVAPVDGPSGRAQRDSAIAAHKANRDVNVMWGAVPYRNSIDKVSGKMIHAERGPATYLTAINSSHVPVYTLAGWFDAFPRDALLWWANLKGPKKLIIGPWFHGQDQGYDVAGERLRWFDRWLKGRRNDIDREPTIKYYVIDAPENEAWRTTSTWPIPEVGDLTMYFAEGRTGTARSFNDGVLTDRRSSSLSAFDSARVDTTATLGPGNRWANTYGGEIGYPDLARNDAKGWTYTSQPLGTALEVIGHPVVHLWITSSTRDADLFVYLEDVDSTGKSTYVTEGVLRASHRKLGTPPFENFGLPWARSYREDVSPLPSTPTEVVFDLLPTAKRFREGHMIRITVTGADRDAHRKVTAAPILTIYRDSRRPSRVILPAALVK